MNSSRYPCNLALLALSRSNFSAWPYYIPALVAYSACRQQQSEPIGLSAGAAAAEIEDRIGIGLVIAAKLSHDPTTFPEMGFVELINITYKSDIGSHLSLSHFETDNTRTHTYT